MRIDSRDAAQAPTGFAEIVSDDPFSVGQKIAEAFAGTS
jgi:hypothetical protein